MHHHSKMDIKMPGSLAVFWIIIKVNYSTQRRKRKTRNSGQKKLKKKSVWLFWFSWSSHLPILISIQREGSSPCQVRENVHEHMAGCEDMSQPLHNLCGQKIIPKLLKLKMTRELRKFWGVGGERSVHPIWLTGKCLSKFSNASPVILTCTETPSTRLFLLPAGVLKGSLHTHIRILFIKLRCLHCSVPENTPSMEQAEKERLLIPSMRQAKRWKVVH